MNVFRLPAATKVPQIQDGVAASILLKGFHQQPSAHPPPTMTSPTWFFFLGPLTHLPELIEKSTNQQILDHFTYCSHDEVTLDKRDDGSGNFSANYEEVTLDKRDDGSGNFSLIYEEVTLDKRDDGSGNFPERSYEEVRLDNRG
ncbi:hypothetical protein SK128_026951 [Halocaridina rubra]|uniref:Uncharacterized protein n=1 Tax=Halocaridina rubra TaxID=373956 RepID=A0AAN8WTT7_HALRR